MTVRLTATAGLIGFVCLAMACSSMGDSADGDTVTHSFDECPTGGQMPAVGFFSPDCIRTLVPWVEGPPVDLGKEFKAPQHEVITPSRPARLVLRFEANAPEYPLVRVEMPRPGTRCMWPASGEFEVLELSEWSVQIEDRSRDSMAVCWQSEQRSYRVELHGGALSLDHTKLLLEEILFKITTTGTGQ